MKKFWILLKIRFKANSNVANKNKKGGLLNSLGRHKGLSQSLRVLFILLAFSPMIILSWIGMNQIYPFMNQVPLGKNTIADAMLSNYIMLGAIMFIASFFPMMIYNIVSNDDEIQLLLTLPVSRTTIFFVIIAQIFLYSIYPLLILVPSIYSYTYSLQNNFLGYFNSTIIFFDVLLFSIGLSGVIALTIARGMKRKTSKKLTMIVSLVNILVLILFVNMVPSTSNDKSFESFQILMRKLQSVSLSNFNPFYWATMGIKGSWIYSSVFTVISVVLFYALFKLSSNLEFESSTKSYTKKSFSYKTISSKPLFLTMLIKDMKLLFREEQTLFMLLYPIGLPMIFAFTGSFKGFAAMYFAIVISSQYCAMSTYASFGYEKQISPYQLTFPIKKSFMLISKTMAPGILYSLVLVTVDLVFILGFKSDVSLLLLLPYSIPILFEISLWSAKLAGKNINSFNTFREAMRSGQLKISLTSMLVSQEVTIPFIFIYYPKLLGAFSWLLPILYFVPILFIVFNAVFLLRNTGNVYEKLEEA